MKKRIQLQGFLIFISVLLSVISMIFLPSFIFVQWQKESSDLIFDTLGVLLICLGYLIRVTARSFKSTYSSNGNELVTEGIYRFIRNPMYLGTLIIGMGVVVVLFKFWIAIIFALVFLLIYESQTKKEEEFLLGKFGQKFSQYRLATPKYFPRRIFLFLKYILSGVPFQWKSMRNEAMSFLTIVSLVSLIEAFQDVRLFAGHHFFQEFFELLFIFLCVIMALTIVNKASVKRT